MSKLKFIISSCIIVLLIVGMLSISVVLNNKTYSLPDADVYANNIAINDIEVLNRIDSKRVDGPNLSGDDINVDLILLPNETYTFRYDIVNSTNRDYTLKEFLISCDNNENAGNYLNIDAQFENGELLKENTLIPSKTKRTVYVTIKYNKELNGKQPFKLYFESEFI